MTVRELLDSLRVQVAHGCGDHVVRFAENPFESEPKNVAPFSSTVIRPEIDAPGYLTLSVAA